jgi:surface protein
MPLPSSLTGVTFTATSGNPPVSIGTQTIPLSSLSLGANSVQITDSDILTALESGATVNPSVKCSYANGLSLVETTGTLYPPPPIMLDTNNVTLKYTLPEISSSPLFIQTNLRGTLEWFAVVNHFSKETISNYAKPTSLNYASALTIFTPPGQSLAVPFNNIVTTLLTDMSDMFSGADAFNSDIGSWDTYNVTNMFRMFYNASVFNQNIGYWNTTNVTNMSGMFNGAYAFNKPIGNWITSSVTDMGGMFTDTYAFNQNIGYNLSTGSWDTSKVTGMSGMFYASKFNNNGNPSIGLWNTSSVTNMDYMFAYSAFGQNISNWDVSSVAYPMPGFSAGCSGLIPAYIPNFTIPSV